MVSANRGTFSRLGFVLAAAGCAIGLGNIWKFPYRTYEHGGGTFVLVYLGAVILIGAPIMAAEILMGRRTQQSPVGAFLDLAKGITGGKLWSLVGWLGVAAGFMILSYYSVVAGWTVFYVGKCLSWSIGGFAPEQAAALETDFVQGFLQSGTMQISFHGLFMLATMGTVVLGVQAGIERVNKILMPILFIILTFMVIAACFAPGFGEAMSFLFHLGPVDASAILDGVGQAFFSLSLGMGAMIIYGSYLSREDSIPRATVMVCGLDTLIALMASVVMFSIIFTVPVAERGDTFSDSAIILFTTLPRLFYGLPGGAIMSPVFYLLVVFAALTSTISLLEVVVAYFIDRLGWSRRKATSIVGAGIFALGVPSALSLGANETLSTMKPIEAAGAGFFSLFDYLATNWMLPVGGLLIAIFAGWFLKSHLTRDELEQGHGPLATPHRIWQWSLRVVVPAAIIWVIAAVIGGKTFT